MLKKILPARPQPKNRPQAYPLGYIEDLFEVRTKHGKRRVSARLGRAGEKGDFFSILLEDSAVTVPHLSRHIVQLRQMEDSSGHFLS
jgi:hypothetical protein